MYSTPCSHLNVLPPESVCGFFYESSITQAYLLPANSISYSELASEPEFFSCKYMFLRMDVGVAGIVGRQGKGMGVMGRPYLDITELLEKISCYLFFQADGAG